MLRCWACRHPFQKKIMLRDGLIKGRTEELGGPYRHYTCPNCLKPSMVETTKAGRYFASPYKDISLLEFVFGWIQPITPQDYLEILDWQRNFAQRRRHFFEHDGDNRYSGGTLRGWIERLLPFGDDRDGKTPARPQQAEQSDARRRERQRSRDVVPHPYRILGVPADATDEQIRSAFQRLARRWHPDKLQSQDPKLLEEAARRLNELIEAYDSLRDRPE